MQRNNKESGYFLIIVLVFIHLFSVIAVYELTQLKDHIQYVKKMWQVNTDSVSSAYILRVIERRFVHTHADCLITMRSSDELKQMSVNWWHKVGCHILMGDTQYFYVVEKLQHDPCAKIGSDVQGLVYYRISMLSSRLQKILQTITAISDTSATCAGEIYARQLGRQSWREL